MWQYCWSHIMYHMIRWFPDNNRFKARCLLLVLTFLILIPEIYVLCVPATSRYCEQDLLTFLIVSVVLTFCMIGFAVLFLIMEPIPWEVKLAFHIFGFFNCIFGIVLAVYAIKAKECKTYSEELYYISIVCTYFSIIAMCVVGLLLPFWIINKVRKNLVLDRRSREGLCYEPVKCCSCVWHI